MPPRHNPLGLNTLQLKTLTLFQVLAGLEDQATPAAGQPGAMVVAEVPQAHGDHFHLGDGVVLGRDATGLSNPAVWLALTRKGLISEVGAPPGGVLVTAAGMAYQTGLRDRLLHRTDH